MLKTKRSFLIAASVFVAAEVALGISLQLASGFFGRLLSFSAIALACVFAALLFDKRKSVLLTEAALIFTVAADFFLVICEPPLRLAAMLFFSAVQVCYFLRIYFQTENHNIRCVHIFIRALLLTVMAVVAITVLGEGVDALSVVSVLYFANLFMNIVFSFIGQKLNIAFSLGLVFFLFCDTFVGFSMIEAYLPLEEDGFFYWLAHPGINLAWIFYVPSQTLLALSIYQKRD